MSEIWKTIDEFPNYEVSDIGNVRNIETLCCLKTILDKDGYEYLTLYNKYKVTKRIHRLVADTFLGKNPGLVINHIDGDKVNNNVSNLEWVTAEENSRLAAELGLYRTKKILINETGQVFRSIRECADNFKVHPSDISHMLSGASNARPALKGLSFTLIDNNDIQLREYQLKAINKMHNGCVLNGGVGSGKSMTSIGYYIKECGGDFNTKKKMTKQKPLYIITTARKRDQKEWEKDLKPFDFKTNIIIDSWNNIKKYAKVDKAFFIFDEQRVVGSGTWVKSFIKIAKNNEWILLTATCGDTWQDYIPLFLANNFYKNRTEFTRQHVVFSRFTKFPKVDHYVEVSRLVRNRDSIMVDMHYHKKTVSHDNMIKVGFNKEDFDTVLKKRWNIYKQQPIQNVAELCYLLRKVVNSDSRRIYTIEQLLLKHPKVIIFYNFDYERDMLLDMGRRKKIPTTEWNGHNHEQIPNTSNWVYIVQYAAGAEGWNCIETDTIIFYSQNYSYKAITQAAGRIDRLNTPFTDLNYYHLHSMSPIDLAIKKAFDGKKDFNEKRFIG